jgi:menaquinone-dependent protoporphyrinogen oxidase
MRILVAAASRHGATSEIADAIARTLTGRGNEVDIPAMESLAEVDSYDAAVIGSAVYYGHWLDPASELVEEHGEALARMPVWLFSSGPLGVPGEELPKEEPVDVASLTEATRAVEHRIFSGRLDRSTLKFRERAMVSALHAPEGDFRDWRAIEAFARDIATVLDSHVG